MSNNSVLRGVPVILSGPSGVGKTTVMQQLMARFQDINVLVTATTRPPRTGEINGKDYLFMSEPDFRVGIERGMFLEWAEVHGCLYGSPRGPLEDDLNRGIDVFLVIDVQGGVEACRAYPEALSIFLQPPSMPDLLDRIVNRQTDDADQIAKRMDNARRELAAAQHYDYWVLNRKLDEAVNQVRSIVVADRCRRQRAWQRYQALGVDLPLLSGPQAEN